jgi:hypothetical protein
MLIRTKCSSVLPLCLVRIKGQIISKGHFVFFNSSKKRTKNFCPSRLGQEFEFSSSFFGRIEDTKKTFWNWLTFNVHQPLQYVLECSLGTIHILCQQKSGWVGVVSLRKISRNFDFIEKLKRTFDTNAVTNAEKNRWVGFQKIWHHMMT